MIGFDKAPRGLLQHLLLPGRLRLRHRARLGRRRRGRPRTRWSPRPRSSASASGDRTRPARRGLRPDRRTASGSAPTTSPMKDYYCGIADKPQDGKTSDFVYKFAREFCVEGYAYRAGDAVNFAIGQGDTIVTPLQLARAYGALAQSAARSSSHASAKADRRPRRQGEQEDPAEEEGHGRAAEETSSPTSTRPCRASPAQGTHELDGASTSRSTTSGSAARPARPRSTASSRPPGSPRTPTTTSS